MQGADLAHTRSKLESGSGLDCLGEMLGVALTESAVYGSNNQVCPLIQLAEELGAPSGSVTDVIRSK